MAWRLGVDIGGTFTDVAVVDETDGTIGVTKVSTTPGDFARGVIEALEQAISRYGIQPDAVNLLAHATTVVTNAILESKGAKIASISTRGFRDLLELRRSARSDLYDLNQDPPSVLVPRRRRLEITERIGADGSVVTPLDEREIDGLVAALREQKVEAVAVSLLFSFLNDDHERRLGERLRTALPDIPIFLSSEVLPEIREFERSSTTAVCAYVAPILESYLARLKQAVTAQGLPVPYVMGSGGGVFEIEESLRMPAMAAESGPAAGVIAAALAGRQIGREDLISFDMGGTTAKASLIQGGRVETTPEYEVGGEGSASRWLHGTGHPIRVPVIDLAEVSAGGGSIAWVDPAGSLRVGPQSAGAEPGPVCYGWGGTEPTVTDANLVLGRLDASSLLGGDLPIDYARAEAAIAEKVGAPLGLGVEEAAAAIIAVVNNAMAEALRIVSVERGHDAREFALICFGGAGPLHASALAEELEIAQVVVPPIPGAFSALGLVGSDIRRDYGRTFFTPLDEADPEAVEAGYRDLESQAREMLGRTSVPPENWELERSADLRYLRQAYELTVEAPAKIDRNSLPALADGFHARHETTYGHANPSERVQIVTLRLRATAKLPALELAQRVTATDGDALKGNRSVWFKDGGRLECRVLDRDRMAAGSDLMGPTIIESLDSTIVVPPGWSARLDDKGFITMGRV
ncbi:MAG: hydantoinase/oxoprolinase family protein [Rhodospirillaceae bacterium]|nr:hydantoinase/oxoprolinase family protein [Rhodospirillaceae bacterium]MBT6136477.1 hydantoinase/oxoprolinase family protein [Rhodospirillaceae bacterium]